MDIFDRDGQVKVFNGPKFTDKFLNAKINAETERAQKAEDALGSRIDTVEKEVEELQVDILPYTAGDGIIVEDYPTYHIISVDGTVAKKNDIKIDGISLDGVELTPYDKEVNIPAYSKTLADNTFLKKSGGTMSGTTYVPDFSYIQDEQGTSLQDIYDLARNSEFAVSYDDLEDMINALNPMSEGELKIGDNVFLVEMGVPDLWVSSVEQTSIPYVFTTEEAFIEALNTDGYVQVGYYKLSKLEIGKIDLSLYPQKAQAETISGLYNFVEGLQIGGNNLEDMFDQVLTLDEYNNLSQEDKAEMLTKGFKIIGTISNITNPIILPTKYSLSRWYGTLIGVNTNGTCVAQFYAYGSATRVTSNINVWTTMVQIHQTHSGGRIALKSLQTLNDKNVPSYPTLSTGDVEKVLTYKDDNTLAWENGSGCIEIPAPASTALTDTELAVFASGKIVKVKGIFLGYINPTLFPSRQEGNFMFGVLIGQKNNSSDNIICSYRITSTNKVIQVFSNAGLEFFASYTRINLKGVYQFNDKSIPTYPTDTTKLYKFVQQVGGNLAWATELYGEAIADNTITELPYEKIAQITIGLNTTFTLKAPQTNCIPEYKALITNGVSAPITIILTGVTKAQTNDDNITITEGANTSILLPASTSVEVNIFNGHAIIYNWEAED